MWYVEGVPCTLDRLVGPVRALGQTLTHAALKQIVSIDDRLVLRSFVGPTGGTQPLLVMRAGEAEEMLELASSGHAAAAVALSAALVAPSPAKLVPSSPLRGSTTGA